MLRSLKWLFILGTILAIVSFLLGGSRWFINAQIGFVTSALVIGASMLSYQRMVYGRINSGTAIPDMDRDDFEKLDDPYELYDESDDKSAESIKEAIKEEKIRMKQSRRSLYQTFKDSRASLSFVRLFAYGLLLLGFFYLNKNHLLKIPVYLISLALPIVIIVTLLFTQRDISDENIN